MIVVSDPFLRNRLHQGPAQRFAALHRRWRSRYPNGCWE